MLRWNVFQILSGQYKRYEELSTRKLYQVFRAQSEITIDRTHRFIFLVFFYFVIYKYRFISNSVYVLRFLVFVLFFFVCFCCWLFPIYNRLYSVF